MSWSEEKAKILLSHRKEMHRVWWQGGISLLGVVLLGFAAYYLAPYFAARFKSEELKQNSALELKVELQKLYFRRGFLGHETIDSCYAFMFTTFIGSISHWESKGASANRLASDLALTRAIGSVASAVQKFAPYMDPRYVLIADQHGCVYQGLIRKPLAERAKYQDFLKDLRDQFSAVESAIFYSIITGEYKSANVLTLGTIPVTRDQAVYEKYADECYQVWLSEKRIQTGSSSAPLDSLRELEH